jgi:aspartate kinase
MGDTTDELLGLAAQVSGAAHLREVDMLLAAGEQISIAMLTMALLDLGVPAVSLTGPQAGILTDRSHGKARIIGMRADRVAAAIERGEVPIVAGFQGLSQDQDVTTLGRGGSDTTAVALAAALDASVCEIYTDVDGVYTADPRLVSNARKLTHVSYEEMLELAACGARVLMLRSVEYARRTGVRLHVRSSFGADEGTWVVDERSGVEHAIISGIAHDTSEAKVTLLGVPDQPGVAAAVLRPLAEASINVDMIVQNVSAEGHTDISFTLPEADLVRTEAILDGVCRRLSAAGVVSDRDIAKVSLIGAGMKSDPGVAADMFEALADAGVNIEIISTSSIRISCVVRQDLVERAVAAVHERFELGRDVSQSG